MRAFLFLLLCVILAAQTATAQNDLETIAYQGVLTDDMGNPLEGTYLVNVRLFDAETGGTQVYAESHSVDTEADGSFAIEIGDPLIGGGFEDVSFSERLWLELEVQNTTLSPRTRLHGVPYARSLTPGSEILGDIENGPVVRIENESGDGFGLSVVMSGTSASVAGYAVYAQTATPGSRGVYGRLTGVGGSAIHGEATATFGTSYGVYGRTRSSDGTGVFGLYDVSFGTGSGVVGRTTATAVSAGVRGETTSSSGAVYGVLGTTTSTGGTGVRGEATATTGDTYGVYGSVASEEGVAVRGEATATTSTSYGGFFTSQSGTGVFGSARGDGETYGVYGRSFSTEGFGVFGINNSGSGVNYGVSGQSNSPDGGGVRGFATSGTGEPAGVLGVTVADAGVGVYGLANAASGGGTGVLGESEDGAGVRGESESGAGVRGESQSGPGVWGEAIAASGSTSGVQGTAISPNGSGVFGEATSASGVSNGVRGVSASPDGYGVQGQNTSATGPARGVLGTTASSQGTGVQGSATASSGSTFGGFFVSNSTSGTGVFGQAVTQTGTTYGVRGTSTSSGGHGVRGEASSPVGTTYGGRFESASTSGRGVRASATASTGSTYGVYSSVESPDGFAGYFLGRAYVANNPSADLIDDDELFREDLIINDERTAVLGLYGGYGSSLSTTTVTAGVVLAERRILGGIDDLYHKWAMYRERGSGGDLVFSSGTDPDFESNNAEMRIQSNGDVRADGSFIGGGADFAEYFPLASGAEVAPGDVVGVQDGQVSIFTRGAAQVMVVSSNPAFVGNPDAEDGGALVALVGQARVRLTPDIAVASGDFLVASGASDGAARTLAPEAYDPATHGPVIGRVLETAEPGWAVALVGVDEAAALRAVVVRQTETLRDQRDELDALQERLARLEDALGLASVR
ncbi:MAG: hypothetical protein AAF791_08875 [Bacteroidota bacterium]